MREKFEAVEERESEREKHYEKEVNGKVNGGRFSQSRSG